MRASLSLLLALLGAAECERAPPEELTARPSSSVVTAPTSSAPTLALGAAPPFRPVPSAAPSSPEPPARCVLPTPTLPPPPVARGPATGCPADPEKGGVLSSVPVLVHVAFPEAAGVVVDAESVRTPHDTTRGLMYRTHMAEEAGMLFDLGSREDHKFWMHNTCIPLDLLYIDDDGLIVGIVENAPTLNDDARGVGCPSSYVLEVNAGWSRRHGVKAGQHLTLPAGLGAR